MTNEMSSSSDDSPETTPDGDPEQTTKRTVHRHLFSNSVFLTALPGSTVNLYSQ